MHTYNANYYYGYGDNREREISTFASAFQETIKYKNYNKSSQDKLENGFLEQYILSF